jgi:hypothetical protein
MPAVARPAPLRRIASFVMMSGHGPLDQWQTQAYWFEYRLECGHEAASRRIAPLPDWKPPYTEPKAKRVRCKACHSGYTQP